MSINITQAVLKINDTITDYINSVVHNHVNISNGTGIHGNFIDNGIVSDSYDLSRCNISIFGCQFIGYYVNELESNAKYWRWRERDSMKIVYKDLRWIELELSFKIHRIAVERFLSAILINEIDISSANKISRTCRNIVYYFLWRRLIEKQKIERKKIKSREVEE